MGNQLGQTRRAPVAMLLAGSLALLAPGLARAQTPAFQGRLQMRAPPECPAQSELLRQIGEQLSPQGQRDAEHFEFDLEITRLAGRYRGRLRMLAPQASNEAREVDDSDCANLVRASALVIAVLVGPQDAATPPPPEPPAPASEPPLLSASALPPPLPALPAPPATAVAPQPPAAFRLWLAGAGDLVTGTAPGSTLEPRVGLSLERDPVRGPLASLTASVRFATSDTVSLATGDAELHWLIGRLSLCEEYRRGVLAGGPCLGLELGQLRASSHRAVGSGDRGEPWIAAVPGLRGSLRPLPNALLFVELAAPLPFVRPNFYFQRQGGQDTVYDVPFAGVSLSAGAELLLF